MPRRKSSPPHTPHGSWRSRAPVRQVIRTGHCWHMALAVSTSCGDSAKNRSGSSVHGSTDLVRLTGTMTLAGPLTPGTDSVSSPVVPDATAVVAGQYMSIPSRPSRPCGSALAEVARAPEILEAADPVRVRGLLGIEAGLPRPDPKPDANPSGRRHWRRYGPFPGTSCCCGPAVWRSSSGRAASAAAARRHHWRWRARVCRRADRYPARSQQATRHTADRQPGQEARCYSMWAPPPARRRWPTYGHVSSLALSPLQRSTDLYASYHCLGVSGLWRRLERHIELCRPRHILPAPAPWRSRIPRHRPP